MRAVRVRTHGERRQLPRAWTGPPRHGWFPLRIQVRGSYAALPSPRVQQRVAPLRIIAARTLDSLHPEYLKAKIQRSSRRVAVRENQPHRCIELQSGAGETVLFAGGLPVAARDGRMTAMKTLDEIERAIEELPPTEKTELLLFVAKSLRGEQAPLPEPRLFSDEKLEAWMDEDEEAMRRQPAFA